MDKKTILAFALSFVVLVGWSLFFSPEPKQTPPKQDTPAENVQPAAEIGKSPVTMATVSPPKTAKDAEKTPMQVEEKKIEIDTPFYKAIFSNVGPTIKSFQLKKYHQTTDANSPFVELVTLEPGMGDYLTIQFDDKAAGNMRQHDLFGGQRLPET